MRNTLAFGFLGAFLGAALLLPVVGSAAAPNVKGKIAGTDKLISEVYAEAAKPESRRWTWREPAPSVAPQFRNLSASPSRDICIAALRSDPAGQEAMRFTMNVTGGRVVPTTIVVPPNTQLSFKNVDPFKHRIFVVNQTTLKAEDLQPNGIRSWTAPGPGRYEVRDELFPSVRTYIVVDPQVVQFVYPRDNAFSLSLPPGEYVLKAFFNGKAVGKPATGITVKERSNIELKETLNVGEGVESK